MPDKLNRDLTDRTAAEALWLTRRRLVTRTGACTQADAARLHGVSERHYRKAEAGLVTLKGKTLDPTIGDLCALARRRYGRGLDRTAEIAGCSKVTLIKHEWQGSPWLVKFWERKEFTFR